MSKAMLVTWPFVMLLLDYWPLERFKRTSAWCLVREKMPFFVMTVVASILTFLVQQAGGSLTAEQHLPLSARIGNALISGCRYLGKLLWPTDLAIMYPHPEQWPVGQVLLAGGFLLGISGLLYLARRRYPFLLVGWLWFLGTLVPVIGLVQVGIAAMANRYTYIPLIGMLMLAVWGVSELARKWRYSVVALSTAGLAALLACMALTRQELGYWKDSETLFRRTLAVTTDNVVAHIILGNALKDRGQMEAAISQFEEAIRLSPRDCMARNNLGAALAREGRTDEAIQQYRETIRLQPDSVDAHINLGSALLKKGQTDAAFDEFQEVTRSDPKRLRRSIQGSFDGQGSALGGGSARPEG
jgi:tetratricopeptide (TPR) repeat protein